MGEKTMKLIATENDVWRRASHVSGLICPVCFCETPFDEKEKHTQWHQDLADFFRVMVGG